MTTRFLSLVLTYIVTIWVLFLFVSSTVFAAGFSLIEPSARATSMGGAIVAQGGDPSVLFVNPAAMTRLNGVQIETGVIVLQPRVDIVTYGDPYKFKENRDKSTLTHATENTFYIPHLYVTSQVTEKLWWGLGTFSRFGLGMEFPQDWPGRYNSYYAKVSSAEINPNLAYKITDKLSLSAGVSVMYFDVKLQKKIPAQLVAQKSNIDQTFSGDSLGYGFNLGLHYPINDLITIGTSYRSRIKQKINGKLVFNPEVQWLSDELPPRLPCTAADTEITLPEQLFFGFALKPSDRLSLEIGGVMIGWSSYDHQEVSFAKKVNGDDKHNYEKKWRDTWRFQTGLEYKATDWLHLRLGYVYDQSPVPDSTIDFAMPDSDRHTFGFGLGFHGKNWNIDLMYSYLILKDRNLTGRNFSKPEAGISAELNPNDTDFLPDAQIRNGKCHIVGTSFVYKF